MVVILRRILSIFFYLFFVGFFILIFPLHFFLLLTKANWAHDISHFLNKLWGIVIMYPFGIYLKVEGREKLEKGEVYIFCSNHSSYLDIPICNVSINHSFRFIGKAELSKVPVFGYMFGRLHIAVDRGSRTKSFRALERAKAKLADERSVLIYPEGTIPDKRKVDLLRFKDGGFRLAVESGRKLVPMTVVHAHKRLLDDGKWLLRPGKITVIFHDPIDPTGLSLDDVPKMRQEVFDLTMATLAERDGLVKPPVPAG